MVYRNVGKSVKINKTIEVEVICTKEKIALINSIPDKNMMTVILEYIDQYDEVIKSESIEIVGSDYELLFSDSNIFEEGKQEGSYREIDLWKMIDKVFE